MVEILFGGMSVFFFFFIMHLSNSKIYGPSRRFFPDEINPQFHHDQKGIVSMFPLGKNLNCSQVSISLDETPSLDGKRTIFGKVAEGLDILDKINELLVDEKGQLLQNCRYVIYFPSYSLIYLKEFITL